MKQMMHLNEYLDSTNVKSRKFINRRKSYFEKKNGNFFLFKKFFEELKELTGIKVGICYERERYSNGYIPDPMYTELYTIKLNESDKININLSGDGTYNIKSINSLIYFIFSDDYVSNCTNDWRSDYKKEYGNCLGYSTANDIKTSKYNLFLCDLEKDEAEELCKCGFTEVKTPIKEDDKRANACIYYYGNKQDLNYCVKISFPDLLTNINIIYKSIFEFTE